MPFYPARQQQAADQRLAVVELGAGGVGHTK